ncbi:Fur family transcriptional regulator [Pelobacter seleniigenes]|uniref:Fur family transcriptional regulator n=1 Tax=Pelobacter seleniigenes TaxID=407188 RepID=UPI0004A6B3A5|nr:transcriptional repressor [Pelobacter seleniigenes]
MDDPSIRLEKIITKLRTHDFRVTPQRLAVLKAFLSNADHPSVEDVFEQVRADYPTTSLATVYKTVNLLKELGEILEIRLAAERNRYDGRKPYPHPHLICTECQAIVDPELSALQQLTAELGQVTGFLIQSHQLEFFGICPACQSQQKLK